MKKIFLSLLTVVLLANPVAVFAQSSKSTAVQNAQNQLEASAKNAGISTNANLDQQVAVLIKLILGFLGVVFLVLTIIAGIKWMTAGGDSAQVKAAQQSLTNSTIGLGIILLSYLISNYVVFSLFEILK